MGSANALPKDAQFEQPMKFELVINLKTPHQIGVTIPPNCWYRLPASIVVATDIAL
jgi:hypothetical protein